MNEYDPVQLVKDATRFKRSAFGKHHIAKLEARVQEAQRGAVDLRESREQRADWAIVAAEAQRWLDYFVTAEQTANNPGLLKRMAENFKKRVKGGGETSV